MCVRTWTTLRHDALLTRKQPRRNLFALSAILDFKSLSNFNDYGCILKECVETELVEDIGQAVDETDESSKCDEVACRKERFHYS